MCSFCGCGDARLEDADHAHAAMHKAGIAHDHGSAAGLSVAGAGQERRIAIERAVLGKNDALARENRAAFALSGILALNLLSSPGSGKTTPAVQNHPGPGWEISPLVVIEGDQQTSLDADRIPRAPALPRCKSIPGKAAIWTPP